MSKYGGLLNQENLDYNYYNLSQKLNPDIAYERLKPFGCLIHPDEIRKIWFFGNGKFASTAGATFSNDQLKNWADLYIENFQNMIQWEIYPRLFRHRPLTVVGSVNEPIEEFAEYDDTYDMNQTQNIHQVVLRHRPIYRVFKWDLINPYNGSRTLNLLDRMVIKHNSGIIRSTNMLSSYSLAATGNLTIPSNYYRMMQTNNNVVPNAYVVDYSVGYESAKHVPRELINVITKELAISIMSAYGDGIVAGAASYSTSLSGISESLSTTMSASIGYEDKVKIKSKNTGFVNNIEIGLFTDLCNSGHLNFNDFQTLSVNPKNIKEIKWKDILGAYEHDTSKKVSYELSSSFGKIRATEDHSLFNILGNELIEVKTENIFRKWQCAILNNGIVSDYPVLSATKISRDKMYDLSVDDFENFIVNDYFIAHNTSAYFGARILQFANENKEWVKQFKAKYTGIRVGFI